MYVLEPILNAYYRFKMKTVLAFAAVERAAVPAPNAAAGANRLLYIHIPFCEALCPYCSFHRYVYDKPTADAYFDALRRELRMYQEAGYDFRSIYVGGGTPTLAAEQLAQTLALARELFGIREVSVETNPNHLVEEKFRVLRQAGVDRLSVGVQSFDDTILRQIGRLEKYGSGEQIKRRLREATGAFATLNVDMIFNYPTQNHDSLVRDMDVIEELLPDQVTFYPLMTAASVKQTLGQTLGGVDYRKEKRFYFTILDRLRPYYTGSTAWCFSRRASLIDEYIISCDTYAGAGSGAFGYLDDRITANTFSLEEYRRKIAAGEFPIARVKKFTEKERIYYHFLIKLFGLTLDKDAFAARFGVTYGRALPLIAPALRLTGAVTEDAHTVALTDRGKYYWVMAMREFFKAVDTMRDECRRLLAPSTAPE